MAEVQNRVAGEDIRPERLAKPVLVAVAVAYLPHVPRLPPWITLFVMAGWGYLFLAGLRGWSLPGHRWRHGITLCAVLLTLLGFWGRFSLDTGVALLAVMLGLKPMEMRSRRDAMATLFLTCYLIVFNLFVDQGIASGLHSLAAILVFGTALAQVTHPGALFFRTAWLCSRLLLQGAPLALALFLFFPRLPGGIFGYDASSTETGFSDTLSPGDVSDLAINRDVAFRAIFSDGIPPPALRYWRGLVLWRFDGRGWMTVGGVPQARGFILGRDPATYTLTLEPHGKRWLFALDMPMAATGGAFLLQDHTLRSTFDITRRRRYVLSSFTHYDTGPLADWEHALGLQLPESGNPRARELARQWRAQALDDAGVVSRILDYFREHPFHYTLSPAPLGQDVQDDFLFNTREGFCEHYASAMAFLLRAAGVPSRVVVGYLGGEENPLGNYLLVRQSEAHAWVEVWLEGRGWIRVDPTAAVAPERVEQGLYAALAGQGGLGGVLSRLQERVGFGRGIRLAWDAANYYWGVLVLDYSYYRQLRILQQLGLDMRTWRGVFLALGMGGAAVGLGVLALLLWRGGRPLLAWQRLLSRDADARIRRAYARFCRTMQRKGLPRSPWEGPLDHARRVVAEKPEMEPELGAEVERIARLYALLRYGRGAPGDALERLERAVRRL